MDLELRGRKALITGASGGIGAACAEALAIEGVRVVLSGRRAEPLQALVDRIEAFGGQAEAIVGDICQKETLQKLVVEGNEPDILVHAAGHWFSYARLMFEDPQDAKLLREVDEESFMQLSKRALPGMMGKRFGRIIAVTSMVAAVGASGATRYAAAKAALEGAVRAIAVDYGRYGITANAVAPGFVKTERLQTRLAADKAEAFAAATSVKRFASAAEVAAPIAFLCSPRAAYITGVTLAVGGGAHLNNLW